MALIKDVIARELLDSRGNPTVETTVILDDGSIGTSSVPSGASTGSNEAIELRDGDPFRYRGLGVIKAVNTVNTIIKKVLLGVSSTDQKKIDDLMIEIDGTSNKSKLGGNSILSVSMACCEASAKSENIELYRYLNMVFVGYFGNSVTPKIPIPMYNLINGGKHGGGNNIDFQEFLLITQKGLAFNISLKNASEIYHNIDQCLRQKGYSSSVGDEGGYAPDLHNNDEALEILAEASLKSNFDLGIDVSFGIDTAANSFYKPNSGYLLIGDKKPKLTDEIIEYYKKLIDKYPIELIEDGLEENDWSGWVKMTNALNKITIVGDDLLCTNPNRIQNAASQKACNAVLIKPNQIGTISETFMAISLAKQAKFQVIVSHRSGETQEDFIADLAVAVSADKVKFGAPSRGERVAKYNRLLSIEESIQN